MTEPPKLTQEDVERLIEDLEALKSAYQHEHYWGPIISAMTRLIEADIGLVQTGDVFAWSRGVVGFMQEIMKAARMHRAPHKTVDQIKAEIEALGSPAPPQGDDFLAKRERFCAGALEALNDLPGDPATMEIWEHHGNSNTWHVHATWNAASATAEQLKDLGARPGLYIFEIWPIARSAFTENDWLYGAHVFCNVALGKAADPHCYYAITKALQRLNQQETT